MPTDSAAAGPRPYLRADARRRHLLDAAARLFARDGYTGMTMVALAAEAGVSRRLVYDHFPDVGALYEAFFDDRSSRYLASIDEAFAAGDGDLAASFAGAFRRLLDIPADDQRAIRLVVADAGPPELARVRARFRSRVEERWLPLGRNGRNGPRARPTRRVDPSARALLWTLVGGVLTLADLVGHGEISAAAATSLATTLVIDVSGRDRR